LTINCLSAKCQQVREIRAKQVHLPLHVVIFLV
jgi:hypothetical protein